MDKITETREATQPIKSRTGGSTFKNPPGHKAWQLIDAAGCRGLRVGDAQVSEMHCNFLINLGDATAADIETLGETVRGASRRIPASISNGRSSGSASRELASAVHLRTLRSMVCRTESAIGRNTRPFHNCGLLVTRESAESA